MLNNGGRGRKYEEEARTFLEKMIGSGYSFGLGEYELQSKHLGIFYFIPIKFDKVISANSPN